MNSNSLARLTFLLMLACSAAAAQEQIGRVIAAVGDVAVERGQARLAARVGDQLQTGDQLVLGAQSNAQIRLTDESIIALRPDTVFRLTEYAFQGQAPENQRLSFELVKGGMRTVTGVIGRLLQRTGRYQVVTPTSTIGIRGTHYNLVECQGNCRNRDGSVAPNGTYGSVTDGRIGVTNRSGETVFGADQYFHVASPTAAPTQLIAPPGFLRDSLEGRARAKEKPAATADAKPAPGQTQQQSQQQAAASSGGESAKTVAQTGLGATTGDMGLSGLVSSPTPVTLPSTTILNTVITNETQTPGGVASTVQSGFNGTIFYRLAGPFNIPASCTGSVCKTFTSGEIVLGVNFALQRAYVSVAVQATDGGIFNVGTPFDSGGIPITVANGQVNFSGTANLVDYPTQTGAFRCSNCGAGNSVGYFSSISTTGVISGGVASLTFSGVDAGGGGSFSANLTQTATPNTDAAATVTPTFSGGASARSAVYWAVTLDSSRRLTNFGPLVGEIRAAVGTASNIVVGSNASAGNLVWGHWSGAGAQITDFNYVSFATTGGSSVPWITGTATNTLPSSLGTLTYSPVGGFVNGGAGSLNSGSLTADFVNRNISLSINATNTTSGNTFQMNGSSGISANTGRFSGGFSSLSCSGPCVGTSLGGSFGGFFSGTQAEGAGVAFTAGFGLGTGVSGVAAFKR